MTLSTVLYTGCVCVFAQILCVSVENWWKEIDGMYSGRTATGELENGMEGREMRERMLYIHCIVLCIMYDSHYTHTHTHTCTHACMYTHTQAMAIAEQARVLSDQDLLDHKEDPVPASEFRVVQCRSCFLLCVC